MSRRAQDTGSVAKAALLAVSAMVWSGGCAQPPVSKRGILDENPAVKIRAMKRAGSARDVAQAPHLVDQLADEDAAVRFYAIEALKRMTGSDLEYRYFDERAERVRAIERWRQWLREQPLTVTAATQPTTRPAVVNGQ